MILETYDKELHDKTLRSEGYENGKTEGISSERENGILQLLSALQELNISRQDAYIKLQEKYSLSEKDAENIWISTGKRHRKSRCTGASQLLYTGAVPVRSFSLHKYTYQPECHISDQNREIYPRKPYRERLLQSGKYC